MTALAKVFVPATIGNVGPGFDVLGLAVEGLGDTITVELTHDLTSSIGKVTGRDKELIPTNPDQNCAAVAALSLLRRIGDARQVVVSIDRQLPMSGGLGASAAASVGGALAAVLASGKNVGSSIILAAALDGEESVAGRHLDNIAPCLLGGLCVVRSVEPPDITRIPVAGEWWLTLVTPNVRVSTKSARSVLPSLVSQADFVTQMANTAALVTAFVTGDHELARRSIIDIYAEPRRISLINGFTDAKRAALDAGALGCTISGAGPSVFALCATEAAARKCATDMVDAFQPLRATSHVGRIATRGAHQL